MTMTTTTTNGPTAAAPEAPKADPSRTPAVLEAQQALARQAVPLSEADESTVLNAFSNARNFATAQRMALALACSTLVPKDYRGEQNVPNVLIALELANRIGCSPFMVMQNLHVIHGRPGWSSSFLIATVNACGRFTSIRYEFVGTQGRDDWGCFAVANDRKTGEALRGTPITIAMAKAEGWYNRTGKDGGAASKWPTMPEQMLRYRAAAFWTRVYAPELALGIHTREELEDMADRPSGPGIADAVPGGVFEAVQSVAAEPTTQAPAALPEPKKDLQERVRSAAARVATRAAAAPSAAAAKPPAPAATPTPPASATAPKVVQPANDQDGQPQAERCHYCKQTLGADAVEWTTHEGEVLFRHHGCTAFGKGPEREPGED